jgi:hypothetical protein
LSAPKNPESETSHVPAEVAAKEPTHEPVVSRDDGDLDDPAWDPNAADSAEYRAALSKNLSLELSKGHGRGRIRVVTAVLVGSFLALMAFFAFRLITQRRAQQEADERAPPPPSGAVYKPPKPFKTRPGPSSSAAP